MENKTWVMIGAGTVMLVGVAGLGYVLLAGDGAAAKRSAGCGMEFDFDWAGGNRINALNDGKFYAGIHSITPFDQIPGGLQVGDFIQITQGKGAGKIVPVQQIAGDKGEYPTSLFVVPLPCPEHCGSGGKFKIMCS